MISRDFAIGDTGGRGAGLHRSCEMFSIKREPARAIRIHLCGADIHSTFTSLPLAFVSALWRYRTTCRTTSGCHQPSRRIHVNVKKILGFLAIGGLLIVAAPAERAQALSLINPGIAAAVQDDSSKLTTEVRWHHHHGWHRHRGWHRHHGWHRHRWHHRHWRRW
jgi:hypothetical protein